MPASRLTVTDLHKSFSTPVLTGVNLNVRAGEIHALIGENGAGKSTLMNILSGLLPYDAGKLFLDGATYFPNNAGDAFGSGISLAAQELSLIDTLSIAENISLRNLPTRMSIIHRPALLDKAQRLMKLVGLEHIDPGKPVGRIPLAYRQLVELAKALAIDNRLLILDEPTSALTEPQAERLHEIIRGLADGGTSIVYISHRLEDILNVADTVSVLRDGRVVDSSPAGAVTVEDMISLMSGRERTRTAAMPPGSTNQGRPVLKIDRLKTKDLPYPVSFGCHEGEIMGIAGLAGSGQSELLEAVFMLRHAEDGAVSRYMNDQWVTLNNPRHAVELGIGFLPEDRKEQGIFAGQSVTLNMTLPGIKRHANRTGIIRSGDENDAARKLADDLSVKRANLEQRIDLLSGGNQQKVLVSRWLHNASSIFLLNEPTRGVDVHTKHALHRLLTEQAARGKTMVIVSSEIEELMTLCDRILVLSNRKPVKIFSRDEWSYNAILAAAFSEYAGYGLPH